MFWSSENGEPVQIAVSMTCPKTPVAAPKNNVLNFEDPEPTVSRKAQLDEEEKATLERIMKELDL